MGFPNRVSQPAPGVEEDLKRTPADVLRSLTWCTDELLRQYPPSAFANYPAAIDDLQDACLAIDRLKTNAMARVAVDAKLVKPTGVPTTSRERREAFRR